jgi:hypothetical protein
MLALLVGGLFKNIGNLGKAIFAGTTRDSPANEVSRFLAVWLFLNFTTENLL